MAPRLLPTFSKIPVRALASSMSSTKNCSTLERMRSAAIEGWSKPNTENTPRIWANWLGTSRKGALSCGLRKNWSSDFSTSPSVVRNSSTTLPMVWRSLTRRYNSSIQDSSGSGSPPEVTWARRCDKRALRSAIWLSVGSRSSYAASRYSTEVATSMATAGTGAVPARMVNSIARDRALPNSPLSTCSLVTVSATAANCSPATLSRLVSPPANADQVSAAAAMRLRANTSKAGSKRPNCSVS